MIHKGIDGALVNLEREPLRKRTLIRIAEVKAATGWVPVRVSDWSECFVCADEKCRRIYDRMYTDRNGQLQHARACPICGGQERRSDHYRTVRYWSFWRPWTWGRPALYECRSGTDVAEVEAIPAPAAGPESGRLTLVRREGADE